MQHDNAVPESPAVGSSVARPGASAGPTVLRLHLGLRLRSLREARRITADEAGHVIRASQSKISRLELGRIGFKERDVSDLLTLYGVHDAAERESLLALARQANTPGWWHKYMDVLPSWLETYIGMEAAAARIRLYEVQFVPDVLQTEDYARAVMRLGHPHASNADIERMLGLRRERQRRLTDPDGPSLWAVIDEAVLWRVLGSRQVMRSQLSQLIEISALPNVTLQMVPFSAVQPVTGGPFTILRFGAMDLPDMVFLEYLSGAVYLDRVEEVDAYLQAFDRLVMAAVTPAGTTEVLHSALAELSAEGSVRPPSNASREGDAEWGGGAK